MVVSIGDLSRVGASNVVADAGFARREILGLGRVANVCPDRGPMSYRSTGNLRDSRASRKRGFRAGSRGSTRARLPIWAGSPFPLEIRRNSSAIVVHLSCLRVAVGKSYVLPRTRDLNFILEK